VPRYRLRVAGVLEDQLGLAVEDHEDLFLGMPVRRMGLAAGVEDRDVAADVRDARSRPSEQAMGLPADLGILFER
jgi:hypothetical protein